MAKIPYFDIEAKIQDILMNDVRTSDADVQVEPSFIDSIETGPYIHVFLTGATKEPQVIGGTRSRETEIRYSIMCIVYNGASVADACSDRDDLLADVESVLLEQSTLLTLQTVANNNGALITDAAIVDIDFENPGTNPGRISDTANEEDFIMSGTLTFIVKIRA